jgi:hypothetical protein
MIIYLYIKKNYLLTHLCGVEYQNSTSFGYCNKNKKRNTTALLHPIPMQVELFAFELCYQNGFCKKILIFRSCTTGRNPRRCCLARSAGVPLRSPLRNCCRCRAAKMAHRRQATNRRHTSSLPPRPDAGSRIENRPRKRRASLGLGFVWEFFYDVCGTKFSK